MKRWMRPVLDIMQVLTTVGEKMYECEAEVRCLVRREDNFVAQELIREADLDGDGNINYEEFISVVLLKGSV